MSGVRNLERSWKSGLELEIWSGVGNLRVELENLSVVGNLEGSWKSQVELEIPSGVGNPEWSWKSRVELRIVEIVEIGRRTQRWTLI